jgi:hypothetical protein
VARQLACIGRVQRRGPRLLQEQAGFRDLAEPLAGAGESGQRVGLQRRTSGSRCRSRSRAQAASPSSASAMAWPKRGALEPSSASSRS